MVSKGDKKETIDNLYESYLSLQSSELYVPDISNCKSNSDVEVVVLVESPAKEEINHKPKPLPLVGDSGKSMSKILFGFDISQPFGEIIQNGKTQLKNLRVCKLNLAIVNVCNVPLQAVETKGNSFPKQYSSDLESIRGNPKVIKKLLDNLGCKLRQYSNANTIIVCGAFAEKYFNALDEDIKAGYSKQLYPPHPSMNQWGEYNKRAADFLTMRELFK